MLGEVIDELKDGFTNELEDVKMFLRLNIRHMLETHGGADIAPMLQMGVEQIMTLIMSSYDHYRAFQSAVEMERERLEQEEERKRNEEEQKRGT
mmetsp:Transcript_29793/g.22094  ORF Transcript_29793/g.22094 Transcript_29793/m.22094 type:complete len:94 (-) Transcript_29793:527-808(-)